MIKNTHKKTPDYTVSAYSDNAAVLQGDVSNFWAPDYSTGTWKLTNEILHPLIKVETHNHPTAISPFPGAATGSGGEIRVRIFPSSEFPEIWLFVIGKRAGNQCFSIGIYITSLDV